MENSSAVRRSSSRNRKNNYYFPIMESNNFYHVIVPFYYLSKLWGFSTYTLPNTNNTSKNSNWWKYLSFHAITVAINLIEISTITYIARDVNNLPPSNSSIANIASQYVFHITAFFMASTLLWLILQRGEISVMIKKFYLNDEMVCAISACLFLCIKYV